MKWIMLGTLVVLGIAGANNPGGWLFPLSEWIVTLIFVNFFAIMSLTSSYYDTISPLGKLIPKVGYN